MKNPTWKKIIGIGLSAFILFIGSVGLTGCGEGEGGEEVEQEEVEQEEKEEDDD